ncbi:cytochrome P450 [Altererythrobacter sp. MF3-039]|uniref:cytochrome P450 n=1 Tax=Altererythrobacter sp. MF3-039 TaxID=3252901 RepID=UPI00390C6B8A
MATAAVDRVKEAEIDPIDVTRAELYTEDRWQEPFRQLRKQAPIQWVPESKYGAFWSVSTHKQILQIEALPKLFSSSWEYGGITLAAEADTILPDEIRTPMFIAMDPPDHTAQRRTVAPSFGPSEVAAMKEECRQRTGEVLDSLPISETFDWVRKVSIELTTGQLAKIFDYPWDDREDLTLWSDFGGDITMFREPGGLAMRNEKMNEMGAAFAALWQERLANPGNDLISVMIKSDAMNHMSEEEFIGNLILLIVGGNDTTRNSMSGYAFGLSQFPEEQAKLEANPEWIPNAVQEIIRWQTPLAHMRRMVMEDTDMFGPAMKKGDRVALWYISANRDEEVFDDPDAIRVDRDNARRHLAFGYGIHRCVGARVAEMQLITLFEEMAKRRLRVNVVGDPERVPACFVHGFKKLPVELSRY